MHTFLDLLAAAWHRFACRLRQARRLRHDMRQIAAMNAHELRDIGFTHPAVALAAALDVSSRCR